MAGKFGFGLKALFVSCAFIVRVAEALDHESKNEDFRGSFNKSFSVVISDAF